MESEAILERLLDLALFLALVGVVGIIAVAIVERLTGSGSALIRRRHIVFAFGVLVVFFVAERIYHLAEG